MTEADLLRRALAYEAFVLQSFLLYSKLSDPVRNAILAQIDRLRMGARGHAIAAYSHIPAVVYSIALNEATIYHGVLPDQPQLRSAQVQRTVVSRKFSKTRNLCMINSFKNIVNPLREIHTY